MGIVWSIRNNFDNKEYRISVIPTHKQIHVPSLFGGDYYDFRIVFEAAIF
jgi:hypothetical protein